jgi:hypothetical protein
VRAGIDRYGARLAGARRQALWGESGSARLFRPCRARGGRGGVRAPGGWQEHAGEVHQRAGDIRHRQHHGGWRGGGTARHGHAESARTSAWCSSISSCTCT